MTPRSLRTAIALFSAATAVSTSALFATCGGGGGGGGGSQTAFTTRWTPKPEEALRKAEKSRSGVLYYFPPKEGTEEHSLFRTKALADFSPNYPVVKVQGPEFAALRAEYQVDERFHTVIVTDWYGNPMKRPFLANGSKQKLPQKTILQAMNSADKFVTRMRRELAKKLAGANRSLERKSWRQAVKNFNSIATLRGYPEVIEAGEKLLEIVADGQFEIKKAKGLERDAAIKALKQIRRDFKGTVVEEEARAALSELGETAQRLAPEPDGGDPATDVDAWNTFRDAFELEPIDDLWLARTREVEHQVRLGVAAEHNHRYDLAQRYYEKAHSLDPEDAVAHRYLGELHRHHTGNWRAAREHFEALLELEDGDPYSRAIALHGIGKMTIHEGEFKQGIGLLEASVKTCPTQLAFRNLAVYWTSEHDDAKAREFVRKALALDPSDPYTQVFHAVYLAGDGRHQEALQRIETTPFDLSMSYNLACVYSQMRDRDNTLRYLRQHFYEYESNDVIRAKEMWEARTDANFSWLSRDPDFLALTRLAAEETRASESR